MAVFNNILAGAAGQTGGAAAGYEIERSLRFNSPDSAYLNRTPSSAGNRKTWTWSGWVKRVKIPEGSESIIFGAGTSGANNLGSLSFETDDQLRAMSYSGGYVYQKITTAVFRDPSAWYHIVYAVDTTDSTAEDRVKLYVNGVRITSFATNTNPAQNADVAHINSTSPHYINKYIDLNNYGNLYLADVHFIDGQQLAPTDFGELDDNNVWQPKAYSGTYGTNGFHLDFSDNSSNAALGDDSSGNNNDWTVNNITAYESPYYAGYWSGTVDATNGPNGAFDGDTSTYTRTAISGTLTWTAPSSIPFTTLKLRGARDSGNGTISVNGVDVSSQFTSSSATLETVTITGVSSPLTSIQLVGNASSQPRIAFVEVDGNYLISGTPANTDSLVDSPTNGTQTDTGAGGEVTGNYCTLNPLDKSADFTLQNGNLDFVTTGINSWEMVRATFAVSSGKWYWEFTAGDNETAVGIAKANASLISYIGADANGWSYFYSGDTYNSSTNTAYGASFTTNDVIGVAFDADAGSLYFYKNGTVQNSGTAAFTGLTSGPYFPGFSIRDSGSTSVVNFGQRPFAYTAPSGFKALCTTNLPDPTIADGSTAMDVALWTGTGSSQPISLNFNPDLIWAKTRSDAVDHKLTDVVRGFTKILGSNTTTAEETQTTGITGTSSTGFTVGTSTDYNTSSRTYVGWAWDAGTSTVSNTDGSITSQVRANQTTGFSICTYTGSTGNQSFGHGLNAAPKLIAIKNRSNAANWFVMVDIGTTYYKYGHFNTTDAFADASAQPVSSTTVTLGNNNAWFGANGDNYVAYCWAPVEGYSAFGSYTGNGSADGPFVYTGFRPKWWLVKLTSAAGQNWYLFDGVRNPYNVADLYLAASTSSQEGGPYASIDFCSNGFKIRNNDIGWNQSGATYIYAAFGDPFKTTRAR